MWLPDLQSNPVWPTTHMSKIAQNTSLSALAEDPTAGILAIHRSTFMERSYVSFLEFMIMFQDQKISPQPQKCVPNWQKNINSNQKSLFWWRTYLTSATSAINPFRLIKWSWVTFLESKWCLKITKSHPDGKSGPIWPTNVKIALKLHFLRWRGTQYLLHLRLTTLFHLTGLPLLADISASDIS